MTATEPWRDLAACKRSPGLFDLPDALDVPADRLAACLDLCDSCPVTADCRAWANSGSDDGRPVSGVIAAGRIYADRSIRDIRRCPHCPALIPIHRGTPLVTCGRGPCVRARKTEIDQRRLRVRRRAVA